MLFFASNFGCLYMLKQVKNTIQQCIYCSFIYYNNCSLNFKMTTNVLFSKRSARLDVFDYNISKNDKVFRYVDLTTSNSTNADLEYKFKNYRSYDYINSIDFDKQSTLTYHLVDSCKSLICYTSLSKVVLCIKLCDYMLVDKQPNNLKIFYNHVLDVFTVDGIFQNNSLISLNINKNIFLNSEQENMINFNVRKNVLPKHQVPNGIYQINNFFNLITPKAGGMILVEKTLDANNLPSEYTFHEYDVPKPKFPALWSFVSKTPMTKGTEYIKTVKILPDNMILLVYNTMSIVFYQLVVDEQGQVASKLVYQGAESLLEAYIHKDIETQSVKDGSVFRDLKVTHSPDFTKFLFHYVSNEGVTGYLLLFYDVQSIVENNHGCKFEYLGEIESPVLKNNGSINYQLSNFMITNDSEIYSCYKTDSFNETTGKDCVNHLFMKYSDKKWKSINPINTTSGVSEDFNNVSNEVDLSLYISNAYNLSKTEVLHDLRTQVQNQQDLQNYMTQASNNKDKFITSPCSLSFKASSVLLPSIEYAHIDMHAHHLNTCIVPKFSTPIIDESGFLKSMNELFTPVDLNNRSLLTYKLVRELLNGGVDAEMIKELVLSKFDKDLYLNITAKVQIPECVKAVKELVEYTVDLDVTSKYGNTVQEQQILVDYVGYKNYELLVLYTKILLFFQTADVKNVELNEVLNMLITMLRKRFKFEQCFKFDRSVVFDIFIEDSPSLNLQNEQNLVITSEYILTKIVIERYTEWTEKYQLAFLTKGKYTKDDLQLFTNYIQTYDVNSKIQNIVYLKLEDYEKVYETALFECEAIDLSEEVAEYDDITQSLLEAPTNFEYLSIVLSLFVKNGNMKELSYRLADLIIQNYLTTPSPEMDVWVFYKGYIPLLSQDGKFTEIITIMNTLTTVKNELLLQQLSELINVHGRKYLKSVVKFNTLNKFADEGENNIIPFAQFYMIKKIAFEKIMKGETDLKMMDYIKLLISYEDTQQALNFLYALVLNDDDHKLKQQYKVVMKAVLATLPESERYVVDDEGSVIAMDVLSSI